VDQAFGQVKTDAAEPQDEDSFSRGSLFGHRRSLTANGDIWFGNRWSKKTRAGWGMYGPWSRAWPIPTPHGGVFSGAFAASIHRTIFESSGVVNQ
jgi:hypothetical protein